MFKPWSKWVQYPHCRPTAETVSANTLETMASLPPVKTPRYIELANVLRSQIEEGILKPGDRLPSFVQIREQYGVTAATVERIYKHLEKDNLVVREQGRGTFVKEPEALPRTGVIGIYGVTTAQHPYFVPLIDGWQSAAAKAGMELLLLHNETPVERGKVDGVLSCDTGFFKQQKFDLIPTGMPCVTATINAPNYVSVIGDEYQAAYDLTQYLLQLGHRRIAYLYDPFLSARLLGYRNAMRDAGIEIDENWLQTLAVKDTPENSYSASGYFRMKRWLAGTWRELNCTALMTQNDDTAMGVIRALNEYGLKVPEQVSVTGFDGTAPGRYFSPSLTGAAAPLRDIGLIAMELLLRMIEGEAMQPSTIVLPLQLIEGASTAPLCRTASS
jgi:GntR family transcriptional regulator of arabinose operon